MGSEPISLTWTSKVPHIEPHLFIQQIYIWQKIVVMVPFHYLHANLIIEEISTYSTPIRGDLLLTM